MILGKVLRNYLPLAIFTTGKHRIPSILRK